MIYVNNYFGVRIAVIGKVSRPRDGKDFMATTKGGTFSFRHRRFVATGHIGYAVDYFGFTYRHDRQGD